MISRTKKTKKESQAKSKSSRLIDEIAEIKSAMPKFVTIWKWDDLNLKSNMEYLPAETVVRVHRIRQQF